MQRNIYLDNVSVEKAREKWETLLELKQAREVIDVREARGRKTAEPVHALHSSPHYHASAMDGIAVKAAATSGASEVEPVTLKEGKDFLPIDTGEQLPEEFNAVIMIEEVDRVDGETVRIEAPATPWQHVRTVGESLVRGELILAAEREIGPCETGLPLEGGVTEVCVYRRPRVGILPSGSELKPPGEKLKPGEITEYNSAVVAGMVEKWGGKCRTAPIVEDKFAKIKEELQKLVANNDIAVITAGSSAGSEDYTRAVIEELGTVAVHGISMKPGGPAVLGVIDGTPVLGLPGYPVAAALTSRLFLRPLVYRLAGKKPPDSEKVEAELAAKLVSETGVREYIRVKLALLDGKIKAVTLPRAAGVLGSLVEADGLAVSSEFSEGYTRGQEVEVELLGKGVAPENTLLASGSNDLTLDIIKNRLAERDVTFISRAAGSLGGLTALRRGECHLAGVHLLDPESGEYNLPYLKKYLPDREIELVNLAHRRQGLLVKAGNPLEISGLADLARGDISFLNRQRGSGTRILLDYLLEEEGIDPSEITGYGREEYTHLTLAGTIEAGGADAGVGIRAAADVFGLDFIPLAEERFDLAVPAEYREDRRIKELLAVLQTEAFKAEVEEMNGYRTLSTGEVVTGGRER